MASTEGPARAHGTYFRLRSTAHDADNQADRHGRRRPFASWMKRLASLKSLHTDSLNSHSFRPSNSTSMKGKKVNVAKHNPYSFSRTDSHNPGHLSFSTPMSAQRSRSRSRHSSLSHSKHSASISHDSQSHPKSRAPTLATTAETTISDTGRSGVGTTVTAARTEGDEDSTFSSPAHSVRSMTTTLTTLQSTAAGANQGQVLTPTSQHPNQPATAIPAHLAPHNHPATYHSATANNVLTDDASVLTLASSSKRRRRNSVDTNASVKALAPASMFGGSRESLPLSVLSGTIINPHNIADNASLRDTGSYYGPRSASAMNAERASLISASGITAPALASERNSYISTKPVGDGGSIRSNLMGHVVGERDGLNRSDRLPMHARNDSLGAGSLGGLSIGTREYMRDREMVTAPTSPMPA